MLEWIYKKVPLVNSEASLLIAMFAMVLASVGTFGGIGVHFLGLDITTQAYISFWTFDFCLFAMFMVPWLKLPALATYTNHERFTYMIEIWIWLYVLVAYIYEVPWVLFYHEIAYAEDKLWAFQWWAYIHGGDIRYLYVEKHVLWAEAWACLNAMIASVGLYLWHKSGRNSIAAVYIFMFCAGMHIAPTVQYYSLEIMHHFPSVDVGNPNNFIAKFILSNMSWLVMPFFVFFWGTQRLPRLYAKQFEQGALKKYQ